MLGMQFFPQTMHKLWVGDKFSNEMRKLHSEAMSTHIPLYETHSKPADTSFKEIKPPLQLIDPKDHEIIW